MSESEEENTAQRKPKPMPITRPSIVQDIKACLAARKNSVKICKGSRMLRCGYRIGPLIY